MIVEVLAVPLGEPLRHDPAVAESAARDEVRLALPAEQHRLRATRERVELAPTSPSDRAPRAATHSAAGTRPRAPTRTTAPARACGRRGSRQACRGREARDRMAAGSGVVEEGGGLHASPRGDGPTRVRPGRTRTRASSHRPRGSSPVAAPSSGPRRSRCCSDGSARRRRCGSTRGRAVATRAGSHA